MRQKSVVVHAPKVLSFSRSIEILPNVLWGARITAMLEPEEGTIALIKIGNVTSIIHDNIITHQFHVPDPPVRTEILLLFKEVSNFIQTYTEMGNVLITCREGVEYTPALIIAHMIINHKLSLAAALEKITTISGQRMLKIPTEYLNALLTLEYNTLLTQSTNLDDIIKAMHPTLRASPKKGDHTNNKTTTSSPAPTNIPIIISDDNIDDNINEISISYSDSTVSVSDEHDFISFSSDSEMVESECNIPQLLPNEFSSSDQVSWSSSLSPPQSPQLGHVLKLDPEQQLCHSPIQHPDPLLQQHQDTSQSDVDIDTPPALKVESSKDTPLHSDVDIPPPTLKVESSKLPENPAEWSVEDVCVWMRKLNLTADYRQLIVEEGIDGEVLMGAFHAEKDFVQFGWQKKGDIFKIFRGIGDLKSKQK